MPKQDGFWSVLLQYHEQEPFIANLCLLAVVFTPIYGMTLHYLTKKAERQIKSRENILKYKGKEDG